MNSIEKQLQAFAKSDLKLAKRSGVVIVTQTKIGTVSIHHRPSNRFAPFSINPHGEDGPFAQGDEATITRVLAGLYQVEVEG